MAAAPEPARPGPWRSGRGLLREWAEAAALAVLLALLVRLFAVEVVRVPSGSMVPALQVGDHALVWKLAYGLRHPWAGRLLLEFAAPRRGDVVVFRHPREPSKDYVKRVVGLPGDVIEVRQGVVHVNGVPQPRERAGAESYEERSGRSGRLLADTCPRFLERLARGPVAPPRDQSPEAAEEAWQQAIGAAGVRAHAVLECREPGPRAQEGPFAPVAPGHLFVMGDNRDRSEDSRSGGGWQVPLALVRGKAVLVLARWLPGGEAPGHLDRLFKPVE